jgi:hypothetical protein
MTMADWQWVVELEHPLAGLVAPPPVMAVCMTNPTGEADTDLCSIMMIMMGILLNAFTGKSSGVG